VLSRKILYTLLLGAPELMPLVHSELLALIAEVSAAFVGFSLIIGFLQPSQKEARIRARSMQSVAELAIIACFGALIVLVINSFGVGPELTWRAGSLATAILWLSLHVYAVREMKNQEGPIGTSNVKYVVWLTRAGMILLVSNTVLLPDCAGAVYVAGLFIALVASGMLFLISTFRLSSDESGT
jgi:hypothetical protein